MFGVFLVVLGLEVEIGDDKVLVAVVGPCKVLS
jgi:hypothetical protein